jgi:hypothetical protein
MDNKIKDKLKKDKDKLKKDKDKLKKDKNKDELKKKEGGVFNLYKLNPDLLELIEKDVLTEKQQKKFEKQKKNLTHKRLDYETHFKKYKKLVHSKATSSNKSLFKNLKEMESFKIDKNKKLYVKKYMARFKPQNRLLKELYKIYPNKLPQISPGKVDMDKIIEETQENNIFIYIMKLKKADDDDYDDDEIKDIYIEYFNKYREEISNYYNAVNYVKTLEKNDRFHIEVIRRKYPTVFQKLEKKIHQSTFPFIATNN